MMTSPQGFQGGSIGDRIALALRRSGLSQTTAAARLKVARPTLNRWINDPEAGPSEQHLQAIANLTSVTVAWLRYGAGEARKESAEISVSPTSPPAVLRDQLLTVAAVLELAHALPMTTGETEAFNKGVAALIRALGRTTPQASSATVRPGLSITDVDGGVEVRDREGKHDACVLAAEDGVLTGECTCGDPQCGVFRRAVITAAHFLPGGDSFAPKASGVLADQVAATAWRAREAAVETEIERLQLRGHEAEEDTDV